MIELSIEYRTDFLYQKLIKIRPETYKYRKRLKVICRLIIKFGKLCHYCRKNLRVEEITIDHKMPLSKG